MVSAETRSAALSDPSLRPSSRHASRRTAAIPSTASGLNAPLDANGVIGTVSPTYQVRKSTLRRQGIKLHPGSDTIREGNLPIHEDNASVSSPGGFRVGFPRESGRTADIPYRPFRITCGNCAGLPRFDVRERLWW